MKTSNREPLWGYGLSLQATTVSFAIDINHCCASLNNCLCSCPSGHRKSPSQFILLRKRSFCRPRWIAKLERHTLRIRLIRCCLVNSCRNISTDSRPRFPLEISTRRTKIGNPNNYEAPTTASPLCLDHSLVIVNIVNVACSGASSTIRLVVALIESTTRCLVGQSA